MSSGVLRVVRAGPGLTVQDLGRPGLLHRGVPPSGALVPELLQRANEALGNEPGDAALELFLHPATFTASERMVVSVDGEPRVVEAGGELAVRPGRAVSYVAVAGGVDVPVALGSRSTLVVAGLGGLEGRMLRAGDEVRAVRRDALVVRSASTVLDAAPIRAVPGPDAFPEGALERLFETAWTVGRALDRTGMRLEGVRLPTPPDRPFSAPMVRGAIQVSHDGTPIVLGPDHPTTGGYAVVATVVTQDLGRLALARPGDAVRLERA
jgi:biotin-dependent carboxylase-like uncharacterized protein